MSDDKKVDRDFGSLVDLMRRLRAEDGCPWDREQTPESLKPYIIEEAHELVEAIDTGDPAHICEELGDLLFQIIFQAQIFRERGDFDVYDVVGKIHEKMTRRHPHVFGEATVRDSDEVRQNWVQIKKDKEGKCRDTALGKVPRSLPSLLRARRITENAAEVGFDWSRIEDVVAKVDEEWLELKTAISKSDEKSIDHELGDALFALVNLSRFLKLDPESSLSSAIRRFESRFSYIEDSVKNSGRRLEDLDLSDLDALWNEAKQKGY